MLWYIENIFHTTRLTFKLYFHLVNEKTSSSFNPVFLLYFTIRNVVLTTHFYFIFLNIMTSINDEVAKYYIPQYCEHSDNGKVHLLLSILLFTEPGHIMVLERTLLFANSKKNDECWPCQIFLAH